MWDLQSHIVSGLSDNSRLRMVEHTQFYPVTYKVIIDATLVIYSYGVVMITVITSNYIKVSS